MREEHERRLCHNCATKPVLAAKTDFFGGVRLLILRNLLKVLERRKFPAYRLTRHRIFAFRVRQYDC